jgi:hypothetical protein
MSGLIMTPDAVVEPDRGWELTYHHFTNREAGNNGPLIEPIQ